MKIYLAGPMRGLKSYNHPAFDRAAAILRAEGHEVFSPAEHDRELFPDYDWASLTGDMAVDGLTGGNMRKVIRDDLAWIAQYADALALLPGWERSRGVKVERALADFLGLYVREMIV